MKNRINFKQLVVFLFLFFYQNISVEADDNSFPSFSNNGNNIAAVWLKRINGQNFVYAARKNLVGWSAPILLSDNTMSATSTPVVSVNSNNNAFIIWEADDLSTGNGFLMASKYTAATDTWLTSPIVVSSITTDANSGSYAVNMDNLGNIKAIWTGRTSSGMQIFYGISTFALPTSWTIVQISN